MMNKYGIPDPIKEYIEKHEFWEKSIGGVEIIIEKVQYQSEEKVSFQLSISNNQNGFKLEDGILEYLDRHNPNINQFLLSDSESSACVIWTCNQKAFEELLDVALDYIKK
ncbi:hypothetical protein [Microbulbifer spongiae]|uniref:Uncharacterized protein n=1 Tax=Microbulbifer spongiae TaxID=2944933 RepID=A0ABY9EDT7_9GAMM|nr:hypothetical protein [Microbulbifer sp. MI-G]WKD50193.1 hypothetical protein M8T91_01820 [Microbulbifer sp. MI-G]